MTQILPYGRQLIEDDDIAAVAAVLRSDYLTTGPAVTDFETAFAAATGAQHALSCSNGTAALHLIALAIGLGPGTCAIVPSITFLATANAVRLAGAEVVFADVHPRSGLLTADAVRDAASRATLPIKAVFPVHLAGQTVDMEGIAAVARELGILVIEDACHAIGTSYRTCDGIMHPVGACAHSAAAAFSLHPVKTIAAGEGGVVTTGDDEIARRVALLRNHGMVRQPPYTSDLAYAADGEPNPWYYEMPEPGFNYRFSDIQAALALSQLRKLDRFARRRRELVARYDRLLASVNHIRPTDRTPDCEPVWHLYQVLIDFPALNLDRASVMQRLRDRGIGTQVHYIPVHRQPYYMARYPGLDLPGCDAFYAGSLSLPLFASLSDSDVDSVVSALAALS